MRTLVLPQFDGPQMIARIVLGSISPCLRFSTLPPIICDFASQFVTRIDNGCGTNFMLTLRLRALERLFKGARIYESRSSKMYLVLCHPFDIQDLNAEQLQYIPKVVLLRVYGDYIDYVWDKLPEHVKADSEVQTYRRCDEHYNQPWQRTHIDGPAPKIKDCNECQRRAAVC